MPRAKKETALPRAKRVTLQDIARVAGVHQMTVSDALNDTRSVAPATRERIKRIAQEMNYVPNLAARALATGRTRTIAILSGAMNEPYYANMVHLIERHLNSDGYKLMLVRTPWDVKAILNTAGSTLVDGAIAIDMHHLVSEIRVDSAVPCVSIGTFDRPFGDHVVVDLSAGVEEALQIMLDAKRRRIAYLVTAPHMGEASEVRARAYLSMMKSAGVSAEIINVNTNVFATVRARFRAYIEANGVPDALLCQNDETAMGAYRILRDCGLKIPEDVLLVGCDGQLHMEYFDPPLSTIVQPMEEMCETAWLFLQHRMNQPDLPLQRATVRGHLAVRASLLASPPVRNVEVVMENS